MIKFTDFLFAKLPMRTNHFVLQFQTHTQNTNIIHTEESKKMQQVHIGHYILGKTIGAGGFAKVKQASHDLTGVKVAVKIINKKKMKKKNMNSKVKRQIKILKFINHPNIIKLYEVLDTTYDIFVIMELASKGELYDFIQNNQITEEQAKFYFRQIISGVQYVHQNLISHRDLKPENILIDSNNLIKIGDFGLSNLMKDGKLLKTACGSPNYAAPQIVGQRKYQGTSVDIWSCGVILYALLVGSLPFDEETIALLYKKIESVEGIYVMPQKLSPTAKDLIHRMLQVDPTKRIKINQIKNHPWLRTHIPIYYRIQGSFFMQKQHQFQLDYPIYEEIKKMNFQNLIQYSQEKVIKSIKKRQDESFVIAYELLKDEKDRKEFAQINNNFKEDDSGVVSIFEQVENVIVPLVVGVDDRSYVYGKLYEKQAKPLAQTIVQVLKILRIQYMVKATEYCIKCIYTSNHHTRRKSAEHAQHHQMLPEKSEEFTRGHHHEEKEHRFTKKEIKFNIQIYALQQKGVGHIVDLQLTQGHPFVFFPFVRKFYAHIDQMLK